jgi:glycine betaine/proline transport system substrate-binding protein
MCSDDQKNHFGISLLAALLGGSMLVSQAANAAQMGAEGDPIKLAINEWTGQHITTRIAGAMLEKLGYSVEYVTAGNYPQFGALADGTIHATLEIWTNNTGDIYPKAKEAGTVVDIGPLGLETNEGWVYPVHMEEICPGLPAWEALKDCQDKMATADTFPQGRILSYPADWGTRSADMIKGLGLDYKAIPAGSEGALVAELNAAAAAKTPLVMMFWAPHWAFADVDVNWVDMPAYEPACVEDPAWGPNPEEINDCGVELPQTIKVAWTGFEEKWPAAWALLEELQMSAPDQEVMMKAIDNDGRDIDAVVGEWIDANSAVWEPWLKTARSN